MVRNSIGILFLGEKFKFFFAEEKKSHQPSLKDNFESEKIRRVLLVAMGVKQIIFLSYYAYNIYIRYRASVMRTKLED